MPVTMKKPKNLNPSFSEPEIEPVAELPEEVTAAAEAAPTEVVAAESAEDAAPAAESTEAATAETPADLPAATEEVAAVETPTPAAEETSVPSLPLTPPPAPVTDYERKRVEATAEYVEASIERAKLEVALKAAKKDEKDALERVSKLIDDGPLPLFDRPIKTISPEAAAPATETAGNQAAEAEPTAPAVDPDAWKAAPIADLITCGLKEHIVTKLAEAGIDTIGRLESLRADISNGREKWPKGIGEAKITAIEDAVVGWLTSNRDRQVFAHAAGSDIALPTAEQWQAMPHHEQCEFLNAKAKTLDNEDLSQLDLRDTDNETIWDEGREAKIDGDQPVNCPYAPGEEADAWLIGWLWQSKQPAEIEE